MAQQSDSPPTIRHTNGIKTYISSIISFSPCIVQLFRCALSVSGLEGVSGSGSSGSCCKTSLSCHRVGGWPSNETPRSIQTMCTVLQVWSALYILCWIAALYMLHVYVTQWVVDMSLSIETIAHTHSIKKKGVAGSHLSGYRSCHQVDLTDSILWAVVTSMFVVQNGCFHMQSWEIITAYQFGKGNARDLLAQSSSHVVSLSLAASCHFESFSRMETTLLTCLR